MNIRAFLNTLTGEIIIGRLESLEATMSEVDPGNWEEIPVSPSDLALFLQHCA